MEYQQTPSGTNRLFLYRNELPDTVTKRTILFAALDMYSIWGGMDSVNEDYFSWEFDKSISEDIIKRALTRAQCSI